MLAGWLQRKMLFEREKQGQRNRHEKDIQESGVPLFSQEGHNGNLQLGRLRNWSWWWSQYLCLSELNLHELYHFIAWNLLPESTSIQSQNLSPQEIHDGLIENVNIELYNALHNHMVNRRMLTKDLRNGLTLVSMYNDQPLHINHYPNGVSVFT